MPSAPVTLVYEPGVNLACNAVIEEFDKVFFGIHSIQTSSEGVRSVRSWKSGRQISMGPT